MNGCPDEGKNETLNELINDIYQYFQHKQPSIKGCDLLCQFPKFVTSWNYCSNQTK